MTREETKEIIKLLVSLYPNTKEVNLTDMVNAWTLALAEQDYETVAVAVKTYAMSDTTGFIPSVGQLMGIVNTITTPREANTMEASALVRKAVKNSGYHAQEEFDKLPPLVQKAVGNPANLKEWAMTDTKSFESVTLSHFARTYETLAKRENEISRMPEPVQKLIGQINRKEPPKLDSVRNNELEDKRYEEGVEMPEHLSKKYRELLGE